MRRGNGTYRPGERYLLQCAGGVERLAVAAARNGAGVVLVPAGPHEPLPDPVLPCGEWLLEPGERILRDWLGRYWAVTARPWPARAGGSAPRPAGGCRVEFTRYEPGGQRMRYEAPSVKWPQALPDAELVRLLRSAWNALATDATERLRRADAIPPGIEL